MNQENFIYFDGITKNIKIFLFYKKKNYQKKFFIEKSENLPSFFFKVLNKLKIKIDHKFNLYACLGPGNYTSIRNTITLTKTLSSIYNNKCFGIPLGSIKKIASNPKLEFYSIEDIKKIIEKKRYKKNLIPIY